MNNSNLDDIEIPKRRSSRQSSGESSSSGLNILPKQCIFCKKDKYVKGSRTRETLTCCSQLRADNGIRKLAIERNDSEIIAVTSDELIAKEALYHFTCYRDYRRSANESQNQCIDQPDDRMSSEVTKYLNNLRENPKYVELSLAITDEN